MTHRFFFLCPFCVLSVPFLCPSILIYFDMYIYVFIDLSILLDSVVVSGRVVWSADKNPSQKREIIVYFLIRAASRPAAASPAMMPAAGAGVDAGVCVGVFTGVRVGMVCSAAGVGVGVGSAVAGSQMDAP